MEVFARLFRSLFIPIALIVLAFSTNARAQIEGKVFVVTALKAHLYSAPADDRKTLTTLNRGRRVQAVGPEQNGFIPLLTRSGTKAWIKASEVTPEKFSGSDIVEPAANPSNPKRRSRTNSSSRGPSGPFGLYALTFDLGLSTGAVNNVSYTEVNLGLNAYFKEWLAWRNALFGRFPSSGNTVYGLDSSVRGILHLPILTAFAGPGYRIANEDQSAPFAEAGLVLKLAGISVGGGVKSIMNSWVKANAPNDTQYFLILSGGGSL